MSGTACPPSPAAPHFNITLQLEPISKTFLSLSLVTLPCPTWHEFQLLRLVSGRPALISYLLLLSNTPVKTQDPTPGQGDRGHRYPVRQQRPGLQGQGHQTLPLRGGGHDPDGWKSSGSSLSSLFCWFVYFVSEPIVKQDKPMNGCSKHST